MHQIIALSVTLVLSFLSFVDLFRRYYAEGNWAEALGSIAVPIAIFYAINGGVYLIVFIIMKISRRQGWLAPFRSTKVHYFGLAFFFLTFLGEMAIRGAKLAEKAG